MKKSYLFGAVIAAAISFMSTTSHAALIDRGGGLIYDDVLDVTWLQDAAYQVTTNAPNVDANGKMTWQDAINWVDTLVYQDSVRNVDWDDWRLPAMSPVNGVAFDLANHFDGSTDNGYNINSPASELSYMFHVNLGGNSLFDTEGNIQFAIAGIKDPSPFVGISGGIWSQTDLPTDSSRAFIVGMGNGHQSWFAKDLSLGVWAVRDGDVGTVPVPAAAWLFGSGLLGLVGISRRKKVA